jgi:hypothetical protein
VRQERCITVNVFVGVGPTPVYFLILPFKFLATYFQDLLNLPNPVEIQQNVLNRYEERDKYSKENSTCTFANSIAFGAKRLRSYKFILM